MEADTNRVGETNGRQRHGDKCRCIIVCAVVMCILFTSMLVISKYMSGGVSEKRSNENGLERFKNILEEAAVKWRAKHSNKRDREWSKNIPGHPIEIHPTVVAEKKEWGKHVLTTAVPEITSIVGWERNVSKTATMYIEPFNDTTIISGKNICGDNTTLIIIVTTSPLSFSKRALVRETWASLKFRHVKIGFLVGLAMNQSAQVSVEQESKKFEDIIQENFVDTYNNLTLKSITLLKWYIQNCPNSTFLMKCDADTFVNVDLLVSRLAEYPPNGILMGHLCPKCGVIRAGNMDWAVPRYMYPNKTYPDFLFGSAYIMSRDVAVKLFAAALKTPIFYLEDVYITGLCAREAGVAPQKFEGSSTYVFDVDKVCRPNLTMCHPIGPEDMRRLYKTRSDPESKKELTKTLGCKSQLLQFLGLTSLSHRAVESTALLWIILISTLK